MERKARMDLHFSKREESRTGPREMDRILLRTEKNRGWLSQGLEEDGKNLKRLTRNGVHGGKCVGVYRRITAGPCYARVRFPRIDYRDPKAGGVLVRGMEPLGSPLLLHTSQSFPDNVSFSSPLKHVSSPVRVQTEIYNIHSSAWVYMACSFRRSLIYIPGRILTSRTVTVTAVALAE